MDDKEHNELLLYFNDAINNIRYSKQQQWKIAYYTLLLLASIFGIENLTKFSCFAEPWILKLLTVWVWGSGVWFIVENQCWQRKYRIRMKEMRKLFTPILNGIYKINDIKSSITYSFATPLVLILTQTISAGLIFYMMYIIPIPC